MSAALPRQHPSDALLLDYAAGSLGEGLSLAVATHLALCPECRQAAAVADAIGGTLLAETAPEALGDDALARALARLDQPPAAVPAPAPRPAVPDHLPPGLPEPLRGYVAALPDSRWRWLAPRIHRIELLPRSPGGGTVQLLRIAPGVTLPHHSHVGTELTLVLEGSFSDELGRYGAGDMAEMEGTARHQPINDGDGDCICLIATEAPLRFTNLVGRYLYPLLGV
jgi:putative transcriptional regulator